MRNLGLTLVGLGLMLGLELVLLLSVDIYVSQMIQNLYDSTFCTLWIVLII